MKKYFQHITILVAGVILGGCSMDLDPRSSVTFEHFFRNEDDLYALVAEMHGELRATMTSVSHQEHMGAKVDWINGKAGQFEKLRNLDPNVVTGRTSRQQWKRYYNVLSLADLFLDNYKKAENVNESRLNFCLGQCHFMRSVCYMWLGRTWGDAIVTKGSTYTDKYTKTPANVVIDTAIYYGLKAYEILPKYSEMRGINGKTLTSKQYGCKGSAAAVLAHLYAWKGSVFNDNNALAESVKWSTKLLDPLYADEVGKYTLAANSAEVCQKVLLRGSEESLFELEVNYIESDFSYFFPGIYLVSYPLKRNSKPQDILDCNYGISLRLAKELYRQNDQRRTEYFFELDNGDIANSASLAYLNKWRYLLYREVGGGDPAEFRNVDCNKVLIRLADIQLLRAECRVKLGDTAGAIADLNAIRTRAGADNFPAEGETSGDLQYLVFLERERELLLEGQRYYDVVRNGNDYVRTHLSDGFRELSDGDIQNGALYLPVPETAFHNNDLMIQNTYWLSKMR